LNHLRRTAFSVLSNGRLENQLPSGDLAQSDISEPETGHEFNQGPMTQSKLTNTARHHVHQNLLISNDIQGSFNKVRIHNIETGIVYVRVSGLWTLAYTLKPWRWRVTPSQVPLAISEETCPTIAHFGRNTIETFLQELDSL
jgi:hypothetical protein